MSSQRSANQLSAKASSLTGEPLPEVPEALASIGEGSYNLTITSAGLQISP